MCIIIIIDFYLFYCINKYYNQSVVIYDCYVIHFQGAPPRMIRPPGMLPGIHPASIPPPSMMLGGSMNPSILSAPPSIMRPREEGGESAQSRVTIQAKPQIKNKMGDVTRFMPTALKVKREIKDNKGRIK